MAITTVYYYAFIEQSIKIIWYLFKKIVLEKKKKKKIKKLKNSKIQKI